MFWKVVAGVLALVYPGLVYLALRHGTRLTPLLLLGLASVVAFVRLVRAPGGERLRAVVSPVALGLLAGAALWLDDHRFVLALPVLINLGLLVTFGSTLLEGPPLVERFARMQVDDLSASELAYCRTVTGVWCLFFVVNASVAGLLAWSAPTSWWALYTGIVAYVLVGLLGAGEYIVRKRRFGRYGTGLHDRILSKLLPPPTQPPAEPVQ